MPTTSKAVTGETTTRIAPEDGYIGRSNLAWSAQWALDWMQKHNPKNLGIISALTDALNEYDKATADNQ